MTAVAGVAIAGVAVVGVAVVGVDCHGAVAKVTEACDGRMAVARWACRERQLAAKLGRGRTIGPQKDVGREMWMKVILAQPRGFCAGVVRAIEIVERALQKY